MLPLSKCCCTSLTQGSRSVVTIVVQMLNIALLTSALLPLAALSMNIILHSANFIAVTASPVVKVEWLRGCTALIMSATSTRVHRQLEQEYHALGTN